MNQRELFLRHVAQTSDTPFSGVDIDVVRAEGSILHTRDGRQYIDLISGISVSSIGHCHPAVVKAIEEQSKRFMHLMVYGEYNQQPQVQYAQSLSKRLPPNLDCVYFTTGGSEAVEGAMKLSKRYTSRSQVMSFKRAYHGSTQGSLSLMGDEYFKTSFRPLLPGVTQLRYNDVSDLDQINDNTAAVFVEPVQGEAGVHKGSTAFFKALRKRCNETGALLVFDEIQTGFGRTGSLFAFEQIGVIPDVLLIAKAMGGGMPIGAFVASREVMQSLVSDPVLGHINTFGGNAVCVAAAQACLDILVKDRLWENARRIETILREAPVHPRIKEVRAAGALGAIEFHDEETCRQVISRSIEYGVISDWFLFCPTAMRIAPPLNIEDDLLRKALSLVLEAIKSV